jgi:hypothetical protein
MYQHPWYVIVDFYVKFVVVHLFRITVYLQTFVNLIIFAAAAAIEPIKFSPPEINDLSSSNGSGHGGHNGGDRGCDRSGGDKAAQHSLHYSCANVEEGKEGTALHISADDTTVSATEMRSFCPTPSADTSGIIPGRINQDRDDEVLRHIFDRHTTPPHLLYDLDHLARDMFLGALSSPSSKKHMKHVRHMTT